MLIYFFKDLIDFFFFFLAALGFLLLCSGFLQRRQAGTAL